MERGDNVVGFSTPQSDGTYLEKRTIFKQTYYSIVSNRFCIFIENVSMRETHVYKQ
jgi:hypothetical protein